MDNTIYYVEDFEGTFRIVVGGKLRMKNLIIIALFSVSYMAFSSQKGKNVAVVKLAKGPSTVTAVDGTVSDIKKGLWVREGSVIKTCPKCFVKLSFVDKSNMNIGPKSELKIEKFSKKEAGVINVLTGKIRSQVTKDYLQMDKDKSKLFVKSRNAVMGVRGTDFMFSTNPVTGNTSTVLFEGAIVFNKLPKGKGVPNLEAIVNAGRRIKPGEVSIMMKNKNKPTVPAKMNRKQFKKLAKNVNFKESKIKKAKKMKSVVPPGLTGDIVASDSNQLKKEIQKVVKVEVNVASKGDVDMAASKGFSKGDDQKPADGVMVHLETGAVIQPSSDATFDKNTGEWVSASMGDINAAGEYIPPETVDITSDGKFVTQTEKGIALIPTMGEIIPVDQMPPIDKAPKIELPPEVQVLVQQDLEKQKTQDAEGPAPAGESVDPTVNEPLDSNVEAPTTAPVEIIPESVVQEAVEAGVVPVGIIQEPITTDSLEQIPIPEGSSVINPNGGGAVNDPANFGAPPPPPSGTTRVKVNVN